MSTRDLTWRKSSYSNGVGGECVEVSLAPNAVALRDSKAPAAGTLTIPAASWRALLRAPEPPSASPEGHLRGI
ncbi:DUF397 domain-containing protein [Amycolatopsis sp. CA-230715]|uniref:DUF397 domain-containing protein n=1 Tax=Amycolatopsis sp. CA-230715 TaxID=2745196 RepID=UPI001C0370E3|nr:DUF397 domain-containing protein [Amycolatopsis sp. CA-230715]QWF77323.1 hypothetical protein HUW46_00715 [Amycolatopsis sp. CA-230715]